MEMIIDKPFTLHGERKGTGIFFDKPYTVVEHLDKNIIEVQGDFKKAEKDYLIVAYLANLYKNKQKRYNEMKI